MNTRRTSTLRTGTAIAALVLSLALAGCESPEDKAQGYYERGKASMAEGDLDTAAVDFRSALKLQEDNASVLLALAELEEQRGNVDAAARAYLALAERHPSNVDARIRLAQMLLASGQADAAEDYANQARSLAPKDPRIGVLKAGLALSRGQSEEAARLAKEALNANPGDTTALMMLVSERMAASDPAGALAIIEQGLSRDPKNTALQLVKLRTLDIMGRTDEVDALYTELAAAFPDDPALLDARINWLFTRNRASDAEAIARQAAEKHPQDEAAQIRLALLTSRSSGPAVAVAGLQKTIASVPPGEEDKLIALKTVEAKLLYAAGKPGAAMATLKDFAAAATTDMARNTANIRLGEVFIGLKKWDEALALSETVLANHASNSGALSVRAQARMATGQNAEAVEDLIAALGETPGSPELTRLLAEAYERTGSALLAEEQYGRALALSGYGAAEAAAFTEFLMRYGRTARAMEVLEDLRARGTASRASLTLLAQLKRDAGDWKAAEEIADLLRASSEPGGSADVQVSRSDLVRNYLEAGKLSEAEKLVRDRLVEAPSDARAQVLLGTVMAAAGRPGEAQAAFEAAAAAAPDSGQGHAALAEFHLRAGRLDKAEQAAREGLKREGSMSAIRLLLAEVLEAQGRNDEAIAEYEALMVSDPTSTIVANNLASLLSTKKDDPKALQRAFEIAIRFQNSEVPQFLDTLGWIHFLRGENYEALPLLKRAAERLPGSGAVQYHLGMVLKQVGQTKLSAQHLDRAVKLGAGAPYLQTAEAALQQMKTATSTN